MQKTPDPQRKIIKYDFSNSPYYIPESRNLNTSNYDFLNLFEKDLNSKINDFDLIAKIRDIKLTYFKQQAKGEIEETQIEFVINRGRKNAARALKLIREILEHPIFKDQGQLDTVLYKLKRILVLEKCSLEVAFADMAAFLLAEFVNPDRDINPVIRKYYLGIFGDLKIPDFLTQDQIKILSSPEWLNYITGFADTDYFGAALELFVIRNKES